MYAVVALREEEDQVLRGCFGHLYDVVLELLRKLRIQPALQSRTNGQHMCNAIVL
jgi:hypothetical protein